MRWRGDYKVIIISTFWIFSRFCCLIFGQFIQLFFKEYSSKYINQIYLINYATLVICIPTYFIYLICHRAERNKLHFPIPYKFGLRSNNREATQACPSTENQIKDLLSMDLPIRTRPSFPLVSLSHQEVSISFLSLSIRGQTDENHNHRKLTNLITGTTALSNSMKL